jgi:hypothetical protein
MIMQHLTLGYVMDFLFVVVLALMKAMRTDALYLTLYGLKPFSMTLFRSWSACLDTQVANSWCGWVLFGSAGKICMHWWFCP